MTQAIQLGSATALAHANIALIKYWGKLDSGRRLPAVSSLSLTLERLSTETTVHFFDNLPEDRVELNGEVRAHAGVQARAVVRSANNFPTAAGLASSASGFAALALASLAACGLEPNLDHASELACDASVSAARSLHGGFVSLDAGHARARPLTLPSTPLCMVVALTNSGRKSVGSTEGMALTAATSPYYEPWVHFSHDLHARAERALRAGHYSELGSLMERSTLAMHASMLASEPALLYWNPTTLAAMARVKELRAAGCFAYFTMDAGPHVKVLTTAADSLAVRTAMTEVPGVLSVLESAVGGPARVVTKSNPSAPPERSPA
jgi:diphosphomevalonate decarboxylase